MSSKTIVVASDHAGVELKSYLIEQLERQGYQVENCGTDSTDSVDYPDFAKLASDKIRSLPNDKPCGILICGSGVGISIAANRDSHIRAALSEWNASLTQNLKVVVMPNELKKCHDRWM